MEPCPAATGIVSDTFPRKKSNGKIRPIFNLKNLNRCLPEKISSYQPLQDPSVLTKRGFLGENRYPPSIVSHSGSGSLQHS